MRSRRTACGSCGGSPWCARLCCTARALLITCQTVHGVFPELLCAPVVVRHRWKKVNTKSGEFLQVDASQETRLRTFAVEDRLMAVEAAVNRLHAVLVPGDKDQGAAAQADESKVCLPCSNPNMTP